MSLLSLHHFYLPQHPTNALQPFVLGVVYTTTIRAATAYAYVHVTWT